ncbi:hypothetical protein DENSPDRAFT_884344 [Dentipellis sp. KUC8613]|nr:hypothetical protein DENSPDRAFT_884344 [Dentipellis sp. KUC8613]
MPSLFSRARTASTPSKAQKNSQLADVVAYDEFGRVASRGSGRGINLSTPGKRDKKKDKDKEKEKDRLRARTLSSSKARAKGPSLDESEDAGPPDGSFFALHLDPPKFPDSPDTDETTAYGYLSFQRHVVLGLPEAERLVRTVADALSTRGLTTPFIFSSLALDINAAGVRRLVRTFLATCGPSASSATERAWQDETRFAGPHELGICLRWGLARIVRVAGGHAVRGLVPWENYVAWSENEVALNYPPAYFGAFLEPLQPIVRSILTVVLSLLARLTAHSASSGHTPPTLSPLFGPLLFGLGPAALPFHHTYVHYLRATTATEHILLAFIRWQDADKSVGSAAGLGVPTRLKDWIRGYPAMLPAPAARTQKERMGPRRGARTVRVVGVRRNVRMYTPDLVRTASTWATPPRGPPPQQPPSQGALAGSREWARVAPPTLKLPPRYADAYRKRMDLPPNVHPQTGPGGLRNAPSTASTATSSSLSDDDPFGLGLAKGAAGDERFRSLTDLKWGEFEQMGFGVLAADEKKLQFDLTESARTARAAKRTTLTWTDFSSSGFSRTDAPLNATLQFSTPVASTIQSWPTHQAELARKLKKTEKSLPPFGWDTEPVIGAEEVVEEAFLDVFCDLVYGGGWMDLERAEEVDRECNWALVEYKAMPVAKTTATAGNGDPRTSSTIFLFEEFVPLEYRQQLSAGLKPRPRLASLFSPGKSKQWKPAATLNGRPYVIGHVPSSPSVREVEFERLLRGNASATKIMSLDQNGGVKTATQVPPPEAARSPTPRGNPVVNNTLYLSPSREGFLARSPSPSTPTGKKSRFRLPVPMSSTSSRTSGLPPSEYENVDFETRLASYSDDELNGGGPKSRAQRRRSRDDAWVDILVASNSRRMGGQDAELRSPLKGGISDPELASQEVAQALAAVRGHPASDDEDDIEPMHVPSQRESHASETPDASILEETRTDVGDLDEDEEAMKEREQRLAQAAQLRQRLSYFDLHPDRRQALRPTNEDDQDQDPRQLLARRSIDSADYRHSAMPSGSIDGDFEPAEPSPGLEMPDYRLSTGLSANGAPSKKDSTTLPALMTAAPPADAAKSASPGGAASRTAALIEMYRERERLATSSPSRIPVAQKAAAAPFPKKQDAPLPAPPAPSHSPSPPPSTIDEPEGDYMEPPRLDFDEGRQSPYRYVHGAPLHNVVEEEEEE